MRRIPGMTTAQALEGAKRGAALLASIGMSVRPTLRDQIADVIGDDHPDLTALIERAQRANQTPFNTAAGMLALLKAGMPTDVVMGGGLDAAERLSLTGGIGAEEAADLIVATVNTFGLGPKYLPAIPRYIESVRRS